jgi:diguanylate cyclase (GGDEF)-like protein
MTMMFGGSQLSRETSSDLAFTDPLTGLGNMRRFFDKVDRLISDRADDPAPFTVGILDLDGFKPINDLFGHKAGDEILIQVAMRLRAAMDGQSAVTRVGADEFAFLLPMVFSEEAATEKAKMLIEILSAPYDVGERTARLSASVGCSLFYSGDETTEVLVHKAETALYQAKRSGRGRVVVYSREMEEAAKRVTRIEQALRRAVSAGEVEPHFQPIVDLQDRRVVGFETLARWTDRDLGNVPPSVFIPIAEERGIIGPLSQLILSKATEAARSWPQELFLSFNLSPSQLVDQNTGQHILAILDRTGFDPRRLEIEITETGLMTDPVSAEKIVNDLRRVGIRVSLDDFGTGQSSLGRLREFHFDKLKIDRAFVASILEDRPSEHIIRAILAMCDGLGMDVVAEGIEEEAQAERLIQFGCAGGQGYLFGKPVNADATLGYLRDTLRRPMRVGEFALPNSTARTGIEQEGVRRIEAGR